MRFIDALLEHPNECVAEITSEMTETMRAEAAKTPDADLYVVVRMPLLVVRWRCVSARRHDHVDRNSRLMLRDGTIHCCVVVDSVRHETLQHGVHLLEKRRNGSRILRVPVRYERGSDPSVIVHANVELLPLPTGLLAVLLGVPLALPADLEARAVDDEGDGLRSRPARWVIDTQCLVAAGERGVVGDREIDSGELEDGRHESLCCTKRKVEQQAEQLAGRRGRFRAAGWLFW